MPPYGAAVLDAVRNGRTLNTFIMAGPDAWNRHKKRLDRVVLPPDASPSDFDWSFLKGQSPLVIADNADPTRAGIAAPIAARSREHGRLHIS